MATFRNLAISLLHLSGVTETTRTLGDRGPVSARLDVRPLGGSYLFRAATSPVRLFRPGRQARHDPVPLLALAVQERGEGLHQQFTPMSRVRPGAMMGMDMTEAFEFSWAGPGASRALMMPLEELDLQAGLLRHDSESYAACAN